MTEKQEPTTAEPCTLESGHGGWLTCPTHYLELGLGLMPTTAQPRDGAKDAECRCSMDYCMDRYNAYELNCCPTCRHGESPTVTLDEAMDTLRRYWQSRCGAGHDCNCESASGVRALLQRYDEGRRR